MSNSALLDPWGLPYDGFLPIRPLCGNDRGLLSAYFRHLRMLIHGGDHPLPRAGMGSGQSRRIAEANEASGRDQRGNALLRVACGVSSHRSARAGAIVLLPATSARKIGVVFKVLRCGNRVLSVGRCDDENS